MNSTKQQQDITSEGLMSPTQVAEFLAVSKRTVYTMVEQRVFPQFRVHGSIRIPRKSVREYLESTFTPAEA